MATLRDKVRELEREEIVKALSECNGVMAKAARILGITERMIGYKVRKYGIQKKEADGVSGYPSEVMKSEKDLPAPRRNFEKIENERREGR